MSCTNATFGVRILPVSGQFNVARTLRHLNSVDISYVIGRCPECNICLVGEVTLGPIIRGANLDRQFSKQLSFVETFICEYGRTILCQRCATIRWCKLFRGS